jgi:glucose/arabinose dehydrogenase
MKFAKYFFMLILFMPLEKLSALNLEQLRLDPKYTIEIFASDLSSPRQIAESPSGRIFVGSRNGGQIFALHDTDGNGEVDEKILIADDLVYPTGVSFFDGDLFFSEIDKIWKIQNIEQKLNKSSAILPEKILVTNELPDNKWHGWKWLMHDQNGGLYTNVGAPCNVCISEDKRYASILRLKDGSWDYIARGVRNSVGFDFHPMSQKLYFADNGRDWLGDDSPSCELNRVDKEGSFYGFPYKHATNIVDPEFGDIDSGFQFIDPILELGAHVAPTGLTFYEGDMFPEFKDNIFITLHGSWNRSSKVGYKVIRVILDDKGNVTKTHDFISGWLSNDEVSGRPAAPFIMSDGSILISDDKANVIYRVTSQRFN